MPCSWLGVKDDEGLFGLLTRFGPLVLAWNFFLGFRFESITNASKISWLRSFVLSMGFSGMPVGPGPDLIVFFP